MSELSWYSAAVRILCHVGDDIVDCWEPVHLLRAADFSEAFRRAIEVGSAHDDVYENADGETVRWEFVQVLTLDQLGADLEDGREVWMGGPRYPLTHASLEELLSEVPSSPEDSNPSQTGV